MIVFFDLDGPLLDVSGRYRTLHDDLLRQVGRPSMPGNLYWQRKRARCSEESILREVGAAEHAADYIPRRLQLIETPAYLAHDRCWSWTKSVLAELASECALVMVTARTLREPLLRQLAALELIGYFGEILSEPAGRRVDEQKARLIADYADRHKVMLPGNWIVGDTEADINAGKILGLRTAGVLCGIRDEASLRAAGPDHVIDDVRALPALLR